MLKLYKNKKQTFECKIEIEGTSYSKAKPRLILFPTNDTRNVFFEGIVENGSCKIILTPNLEIPKTGRVLLEVIIDDTTLFQPWESNYEIVTEKIKVVNESISLNLQPSNGPTVKIIEDVVVKDDKNKVIEPTIKKVDTKPVVQKKPFVKEQKKKKEIFLESCGESDKKLVNEFLETVHSLQGKKKKALLEYINTSFNPSSDSIQWAKKIFKEDKSLATRIAMYCREVEQDKVKK